MKTVSLIFTLMTFTLNVIGQITEKVVYQEKGETETYEIRKGDKSKFIYRAEISFEKVASLDVAVKEYKVWPIKTILNDKEYVKKYLKSEIKENITSENSFLAISYFYELTSGKIKWITVFHNSSITIPIKAIEKFEKIMRTEDKATFNRNTSDIKDILFFERYVPYDLLNLD